MNNRIKVLRAEQDWSQQALADKIGVSRQAVNAVERGKHDPSLQLAFDIANQFNQCIEDIFFPDKK
jgi:putative transcriptional regulator